MSGLRDADDVMPIIRSSRVLYRWLLLVVLGALVLKLSVWCGAVGCVSGLRDADDVMLIIRSSRVLYRWLLLVVLGALVFKLSVWRGAVGCVYGLRDADDVSIPLLLMDIMVHETC
jgi:hypothetical protein